MQLHVLSLRNEYIWKFINIDKKVAVSIDDDVKFDNKKLDYTGAAWATGNEDWQIVVETNLNIHFKKNMIEVQFNFIWIYMFTQQCQVDKTGLSTSSSEVIFS